MFSQPWGTTLERAFSLFPTEAQKLFRPTNPKWGSRGGKKEEEKKRHLAEAGGEGDGLLGGGELGGVGVPGGLRHGGAESWRAVARGGSGGGARVVGEEAAGKIRRGAEARWAQRDGGGGGGVERVRERDRDEAHARRSSHVCAAGVGAEAEVYRLREVEGDDRAHSNEGPKYDGPQLSHRVADGPVRLLSLSDRSRLAMPPGLGPSLTACKWAASLGG